MRKKLITYVVIFFILQFTKSLLINDYKVDYGKSRIEMLVRSPGSVEYEKVRNNDKYNEYLPILIKKKKESIIDVENPIMLVGTTYNYGQLEHLIMVDGAFFIDNAVEEERNVAVISDQLSMKLFGSTKAAGNILNLNQKFYKVVGVYKKHRRMRDYIKDDSYERIYIPITCKTIKEEKVEAVIIDGNDLKEMPDESTLSEMGLNSSLFIKNDQTKWLEESKSLGEIPFIVFNFILSIVVVKLFYKTGKSYRKNYLVIGIWVISLGACAAYIYFVCKMSFANLYISSERLPKENIFELKFYWDLLCQDWANNNLFMISGIAPFRQMLTLLKTSLHCVNIVQYILMVKIVLILKAEGCNLLSGMNILEMEKKLKIQVKYR